MVTGSGPQSNVMMPPFATAATKASPVHPAGVPFPMTVVGDDTSSGWASGGMGAWPSGQPAGGLSVGFVGGIVDPSEPDAANVLAIGDRVLCASAHTNTRRRIEAYGSSTVAVPAGELAKAEGGVTCCSIIFAATS